jgi:hypothetical protein
LRRSLTTNSLISAILFSMILDAGSYRYDCCRELTVVVSSGNGTG